MSDMTEFHGLRVHDFLPGRPAGVRMVPDVGTVAWRLFAGKDASSELPMEEQLRDFLSALDDPGKVRVLVLGPCDEESCADPAAFREQFAAAGERLTGLRALYLGDGGYVENYPNSSVSYDGIGPMLAAYPGLENLWIFGDATLASPPVRHDALRELRIESAAMAGTEVAAIARSTLPALSHLELWLGAGESADATPGDLEPLLDGAGFPALRYLGLCNSEREDEVAEAAARAPVVSRLRTLDLSRGILTDRGAEALLAGQDLTHLTRLNLWHNFVSDAVRHRVRKALEPAGVEVPFEPGWWADGRPSVDVPPWDEAA